MSERTQHPLPPTLRIPLIGSQTGRFLLQPWFDRVTVRWVTRWFFPISRGWAAARAADGSVERFHEQLGISDLPSGVVERLLEVVQKADAVYQAANGRWQQAFFESRQTPSASRLARAEDERQRAAHNLMAGRMHVFPLRLARRLPAIAFHITDAKAVERAHGHRLAGADAAFPAPSLPAMEESRKVEGHYGEVSWLRWPSPLGDRAWARVYTPPGVSDPPTLVYLHGIGMEMEMWRVQSDPINAYVRRAGIRVIRPEGPWHGRRMRPGYYGGEPALAFAPKSYIDLIAAWVAETAQLIAWARATSRGPVAVGGLSLGALTAQIVGTAASSWPAELRPEAMFLVATSSDVAEICHEGSFSRGLGVPDALFAAGWTREDLGRWRPLLEPQGEPVMPAERIVMLLGSKDTVTPFASGMALAHHWGVPETNLFIERRGHFSTPLGLHQDDTPVRRAVELLVSAG